VARRPLPFDILKRATRCRAKKKINRNTYRYKSVKISGSKSYLVPSYLRIIYDW